MTRAAAPLLALALVTLPLALAPPAAAHCPSGSAGHLLLPGVISTCPLNQSLEDAVAAANAASGGRLAFVLLKDFRFHPDVVSIKTGGTVVFVYADTDQSQQHDPRSSGGCSSGTPLPEPEQCVLGPTGGACFDVHNDDGGFMVYNGQTYPVTLRYVPATGVIQKSRGLMSGTLMGDLTGAKPFTNCSPVNGVDSGPAGTTIPYHCGIHGLATTTVKLMRGAIVITA